MRLSKKEIIVLLTTIGFVVLLFLYPTINSISYRGFFKPINPSSKNFEISEFQISDYRSAEYLERALKEILKDKTKRCEVEEFFLQLDENVRVRQEASQEGSEKFYYVIKAPAHYFPCEYLVNLDYTQGVIAGSIFVEKYCRAKAGLIGSLGLKNCKE